MGMMALIQAGDATNAAQLDTYKPAGTAEKRYEELKAELAK